MRAVVTAALENGEEVEEEMVSLNRVDFFAIERAF